MAKGLRNKGSHAEGGIPSNLNPNNKGPDNQEGSQKNGDTKGLGKPLWLTFSNKEAGDYEVDYCKRRFVKIQEGSNWNMISIRLLQLGKMV